MIDQEKLLRNLVALPSVNPAFLPPGHPQAGELRIAEYIASLAGRAGLDVDFQKVQPERRNVFARLAPAAKVKRRILLAPHLDTVAPLSPGQLSPSVRHGRLYGRGACDTKGSIAAMLAALLELSKHGRPQHTEIIFAGLVDEENSQAGARALAACSIGADLAIVGEPTRLQIVTAHKGCLWLRLETRGRAAHGSCPNLGRNAVYDMARAINLIETDYARHLARRRHPLLGSPTVNVGMVRGGAQPNIVPAQCIASVDRRTLPGESEQSVLRELRAIFRRHSLRPGIVNERMAFCQPMETDASLPLVRALMEIAGQSAPVGVNYFCDASALSQAGIPSVVFGPGNIAQAHTADEWIALASVQRAVRLLLKFFATLP